MAFPTLAVFDTFSVDGDPLPGNWQLTEEYEGYGGQFKALSGLCRPEADDGAEPPNQWTVWTVARTDTLFDGADTEFYFDLVEYDQTKLVNMTVFMHDAADAYYLGHFVDLLFKDGSNSRYTFYRYDIHYIGIQLATGTFPRQVAAGDGIGFSVINGLFTMYFRDGPGGSWTALSPTGYHADSVSDTGDTFKIYLSGPSGGPNLAFDNFGGGSVPAGGTDFTPGATVSIVTMPGTQFRRVTFSLYAPGVPMTSPISQADQHLEILGAQWKAEYELPPMRRADAEPWIAWLTTLQGSHQRFYAWDPSATAPRGSVAGSPVVDGASQTGTTLNTTGWTPNAEGVLLTGDFLAFETPSGWRELHQVVNDVDADGSGDAAITIAPPIRESPDDTEPLITTQPSCVMHLPDNAVQWSVDEANIYTIKFNAEESFLTRERS